MTRRWTALVPGLVAVAVVAAMASLLTSLLPASISVITVGRLAGILIANTTGVAERLRPGIRVAITEPPVEAPGRSTQECVVNGAGLAIAALFERTVERFAGDTGSPVRCVVSGGGAPALIPLMQRPVDYDPDLVLRGLALVAGS